MSAGWVILTSGRTGWRVAHVQAGSQGHSGGRAEEEHSPFQAGVPTLFDTPFIKGRDLCFVEWGEFCERLSEQSAAEGMLSAF